MYIERKLIIYNMMLNETKKEMDIDIKYSLSNHEYYHHSNEYWQASQLVAGGVSSNVKCPYFFSSFFLFLSDFARNLSNFFLYFSLM